MKPTCSGAAAFIKESDCREASLAVTATLYRHPASGARILDIQGADPENLLSVLFLTPPPDDTGLPHILEHAVLGGSRKYPVKDPFFHMLKMSMATFLNAMTGPDYTIYPCASNVAADFFNLADVYLDAVFHPLLHDLHFQQEGYHYAFDPPDAERGRLTLKGIVYNEMRGAYSSANQKLQRVIERGLFPDSVYGRDAGGDPDRIPDLTYADFVAFHRRHYHPSNALIVHYGDIAPSEWMPFLDARLAAFEPRSALDPPPAQPRWTAPRLAEDAYPIGSGEPMVERSYLVMSWLTAHGPEPFEQMAMETLFQILLGHAGAPLYRALIDSRLGHDLTHCYSHAFGRELTFHVGIKGSEPERRAAFEQRVFDTLEGLTQPGAITTAMAETALTRLGYTFQEITDGFPLKLASQIYHSWTTDGDPFVWLNGRGLLDDVRKRIARDPGFLAGLIRDRLLDNPHRLTSILRPDPDLAGRQDAALTQRLTALNGRLTADERRHVIDAAHSLEQFQQRTEAPETLDRLPQLRVADLPRQPRTIPTTVLAPEPGLTVLRNDLPSNGVNYLSFAVDLSAFPLETLLRLHAVYTTVALQMGAAGLDFADTAARIAAHTGGLSCIPLLTTRHDDPDRHVLALLIQAKFLDSQADAALAVLHDLLFQPEFDDPSRLTDLLTQLRERHHSHVVENALSLAMPLAARHLGAFNALVHAVSGLPVLRDVDRAVTDFKRDPSGLPVVLKAMNQRLTAAAPWIASFTGSDSVYARVESAWRAWRRQQNGVADGADGVAGAARTASDAAAGNGSRPPRQGLAAPMDVAFHVMSLPLPHSSHADAELLEIGTRLLSFDYLLDEIRFKGSAYGAGCSYQASHGVAHCYSYRDPAMARTLAVFRDLPAAARRAGWRQADIDRGIIGTAKNNLRPLRPGSATRTALTRHLCGITPAILATGHERLLSASAAAVQRALADHLDAGLTRAGLCIVSSRERLATLASEMPAETALEIEDILSD